MSATSEFFNVQTVGDALEALFAHWQPTQRTERLDPRRAVGRILAESPCSPIDLPTFPRSTMDGYAVRAADTFGASQSLPAYLRCVGVVAMGSAPTMEIRSGQAVEIHTGAMLPTGADAVVMVERAQTIGDGSIEVLAPVAPGENVVQVGEDVERGAPILPAGHRIRPQDVGGLLAAGCLSVALVAPPRVGILSCGDELIPPEGTPAPGQIRDINAYMLAAYFETLGASAAVFGIARDQLDDLVNRARVGLEQVDILVLTAGSSVSARDLTREAISSLGQPGILQHGLAVKPGKPTIIAVCGGKPVIGLPGNPVSALLVARQIVAPIIRRASGEKTQPQATIQATLTGNIPSATGREDTVPVRLTHQDGAWQAEPVFGKSNLIFTLIAADGLVRVPLNSGGLKAGTTIEVTPF